MPHRALIAVLLVLGLASPAWAVIAQVGSDQVGANDGSTCASTFAFGSRTIASGSEVVVTVGGIGTGLAPAVSSVTDDNGGSYSCTSENSGGLVDTICHADNHAAGATNVTVNYLGTVSCRVTGEMSEWSGVGSTVVVDQSSTGTNANGTVDTGVTGTTAQASELAIASAVQGNAGALAGSPTGGFTKLTTSTVGSGSTGGASAIAYNILTSTTTVEATWFNAPSASWAAVVITVFFIH